MTVSLVNSALELLSNVVPVPRHRTSKFSREALFHLGYTVFEH